MTLRGRIALTAAAIVTVVVVVAFGSVYLIASQILVDEVDESMQQTLSQIVASGRLPDPDSVTPGFRSGPRGAPGGYVRIIDPTGAALDTQSGSDLGDAPVSVEARDLAQRDEGLIVETMAVDGDRFRALTVATDRELAVQILRPLAEVDRTLASLGTRLVAFGLVGVVAAAALGLLIARRAVEPVRRLTGLAEDVADTQDLTRRIEVEGSDELARLAATFNGMLGALDQARTAQEQLVADASHELRTPLTSLRTNIEVLAQVERLSPDARRDLIDDVVVQLDEFSRLVGGLVELARGERPASAAAPTRLDDVVERVVARVRTHDDRGVTITVQADASIASIEVDRVERAVSNMVDNAVKYGDGPIEVTVADKAVTVRDHGRGFSEDDLPHVFDRFWRADDARSAPGSGLGLSIVRQVAAAHGGTATASNAPDGGAVVQLALPRDRHRPSPA